MEKKSKKKAPSNTADIRSFFAPSKIAISSTDENSIVDKSHSNGDHKMPKRKKIYVESGSDEDVIQAPKRSKKTSKQKNDSDSDEFVPLKSKKVSKRKDDSDSDDFVPKSNKKISKRKDDSDDFVPKSNKKKSKRKDDSDSDEFVPMKSKKVSKRKDDSDSDDFVPKSNKKISKRKDDSDDFVPKSNKKKSKRKDDSDSDEYIPTKSKEMYLESESDEDVIQIPKKSKKKTKQKDDSDDDSKPKKSAKQAATKKAAPKKSSAKSTGKAAGKQKSSKDKLVKPIDFESDEKHPECEIVRKKDEPVKIGFESFLGKSHTSGDKKKNNQGILWVERHKPRKLAEIVGQNTPKSNANKLKNWLQNFERNLSIKPKFKDDTGAGLRAALLSGIAGIGKTTTAQLVAKECGWDYVEFNASDTRNKKGMDTYVETLISNKSLSGYIQDPNHQTEMTKKHLVIMDEVDGMAGNADRGGIAELIQFIKKTQIPIICICNDRQSQKIRNLANYCFDLRFSKLRVEAIRKRINEICAIEGIKISSTLLEELIETSNRDMRQIIHYLSVFGTKTKTLSDMEGSKLIKNVTLGLFEATHAIFSAGPEYDSMTFNDKQSLFFSDYDLLPLMTFENYLSCKPKNSKTAVDTLSMACKSIDAMCVGDIINNEIRSHQSWNLLPLQACFSTVLPGYYMNGHLEAKIEFTGFLAKNSTMRKRERLASELKQHMNLTTTGSKTCLVLDLMLPLREKIIRPLLNGEKDAIPNSIKTLINYNLLKDDLDSVCELSLWPGEKSPYASVDTKTKAAFTRSFNGTSWTMPYSFQNMYKKVGKGVKEPKSKGKKDDEEVDEEPATDETLLPEF